MSPSARDWWLISVTLSTAWMLPHRHPCHQPQQFQSALTAHRIHQCPSPTPTNSNSSRPCAGARNRLFPAVTEATPTKSVRLPKHPAAQFGGRGKFVCWPSERGRCDIHQHYHHHHHQFSMSSMYSTPIYFCCSHWRQKSFRKICLAVKNLDLVDAIVMISASIILYLRTQMFFQKSLVVRKNGVRVTSDLNHQFGQLSRVSSHHTLWLSRFDVSVSYFIVQLWYTDHPVLLCMKYPWNNKTKCWSRSISMHQLDKKIKHVSNFNFLTRLFLLEWCQQIIIVFKQSLRKCQRPLVLLFMPLSHAASHKSCVIYLK